MEITISRHAAERAAERGITEEGIKNIVRGDVYRVVIPNEHDSRVAIFTGMYEAKLWSVICDIYTRNVVTVRRAHRKEEADYYAKYAKSRIS